MSTLSIEITINGSTETVNFLGNEDASSGGDFNNDYNNDYN